MKISHLDSTPPSGLPANERKAGPAVGAAMDSAKGQASANVALSSTAAHLVGPNAHVFDAEKVTRISNAIRDGKYTINPDVIADKLIANAKELVGQQTRKPGHLQR